MRPATSYRPTVAKKMHRIERDGFVYDRFEFVYVDASCPIDVVAHTQETFTILHITL